MVQNIIILCSKYEITVPAYKKTGALENSYLKLLCEDTIADNSLDVLSLAVKTLKDLLDQHVHEFPRIMGEILNEIREPLIVFEENPDNLLKQKQNLTRKIISIDEEIDLLENEREVLIEKAEYSLACALKQEINAKAAKAQECEQKLIVIEDEIINRLYRSLAITTEMLCGIKYGVMILDIPEFVQNLIKPALEIDQEPVQILAFDCLTQCCLHNLEICKENLRLFSMVLKKQSDSMLEFVVIKSVIDLYMVWDFCYNACEIEVFNDDIIKMLMQYTQSSNEYIKAITIEGLAKLTILGKISSPITLAYLMIPYFDTTSSIVSQVLQVFFGNFTQVRAIHCETLSDSFKMVLSLLCLHIGKTQSIETIDFSYFNIKKVFNFI